ncbi:MAG TPA: response regulator transcription factor [Candidatus Scatomorpha pullicola]|nr:response regulator transcription factor [Candidatus Scatomorpha pullicola]
MERKVLIVDDERSIVDILKYNIEKDGTKAICAYDGKEGLRLARTEDPDVILLDVMLPEMDGFEVCRTLRAEGNNVPIIMITAREEETDKVFGLDLGADDYITKPFSMRELLARVRTNMRRAASMLPAQPGSDADVIRAKDLVIDRARRSVSRNGHEIELTQREYELIKYLAENPGKVMSREELMSAVWQYDYFGDLRAVDVAVRRLREKVEDNPSEPQYVITKRGAGYYFAD